MIKITPLGRIVLNGPHVETRPSPNVKITVPDPIKVRVTGDSYVVDLVVRPDPETLDPAITKILSIEPLGDRPIPKDVLRSIGLGRVLEQVVRRFCIRWELSEDGRTWQAENFKGKDPTPAEMRKVMTRPRSREVTDSEVVRAAEVYRKAIEDGRRDATMAVAEALTVSRATAARRIDKAREKKLLGPAQRATAGEAAR